MTQASYGILRGDAGEGQAERSVQGVRRACGDAAQLGFDLGPGGLDRVEVRAVGGQVAADEPGTVDAAARSPPPAVG